MFKNGILLTPFKQKPQAFFSASDRLDFGNRFLLGHAVVPRWLVAEAEGHGLPGPPLRRQCCGRFDS